MITPPTADWLLAAQTSIYTPMPPSSERLEATSPESRTIYDRNFWMAYVANFALVAANSLMFRFAEFVAFLGGDERAAGTIVGTGFAGVLLIRLVLGRGIDHYGTRAMWMASSLLFLVACVSFWGCHHVGVGLYAARTIYSIAVAGMFTCSIVQIQNSVPVHRRTEAIGVLGTSGFVGMIVGSNLADGIFAWYPEGSARFFVMFGSAAAMGMIYLPLVVVLTRRDVHVRPVQSPAVFRLLVRYWPGAVVVVALTFGMALGVTTVFLTRYATARKLGGIHTFFTTYSIVALIFRVPSTHWARAIGRHKTMLIGLCGNSLGHLLLPFVKQDWQFFFPATACGFGHAVLYPVIVSLGAGAFPRRYRGVGTTLTLGFIELGTAISPPILGWIIDRHGFDRMFYCAAGFGLLVTVFYGLTAARQPDNDNDADVEDLPEAAEGLAAIAMEGPPAA